MDSRPKKGSSTIRPSVDQSSVSKHSIKHNKRRATSQSPDLTDNMTVKEGCDMFKFWNDDVYLGNFRATVQGNIVRQGRGQYSTGDDQLYKGVWENDRLVDDVSIHFPDGSRYVGLIDEDLRYTGRGMYKFNDSSSVHCEFLRSRPKGYIYLKDPYNNTWEGSGEDGVAFLLPVNRFLPPQNEM